MIVKNTKILFVRIVLLSLLGLVSLPAVSQYASDSYVSDVDFVGQIPNSDIFVAIVTSGSKTLAYVCDGIEIAEWFSGSKAEYGWLELTSKKGWKLKVNMGASSAVGSLTIKNNQPISFTTTLAKGRAGLYRAEKILGETKYVGGWIVNSNGEQRGAVVGGGTFQTVQNIDTQFFQAEVENLGTFTTQVITPTFVNEFVNP